MLTSSRGRAAVLLACAGLSLSAPAFAQEQDTATGDGGLTVSGNVAITSDYRYRGVSLSGGDPAVQGGITVAHETGFYAGAWASSIDDGGTEVFGDLELDVFGGWSGNLAETLGIDVALLYYAYPTNVAGADVEYFEPYATLSSTIGPIEVKVGATYAWEQDSLGGGDNLYLFTKLAADIPTTPVTLSASVGYTDGVLAPPLLAGTADDTGFDWSLGASMTVLGSLGVAATYTGVEGPSLDGFTDDAIVATLSASF